MRILIITGGRIDESFALSLLQKEKFDHMIVVDGALAFWDKVERNPEIQCHFDHLVGDFDTISPNILEKLSGHEKMLKFTDLTRRKTIQTLDIALKAWPSVLQKTERGRCGG